MATADLALSAPTRNSLRHIIANPPHALLLTGANGIGKRTVASWIASQLLNIDPSKLHDHPHVIIIEPEPGKAIGIEAVRELEHVMSLKIPGNGTTTRVIIIDQAHKLTSEAQNALLKTLEEPPVATVIILTAPQASLLLPTIRSRSQALQIIAPEQSDLAAALPVAGKELQQTLALSGGLPGLAFTLSGNDMSHPTFLAATTARSLLQQTTFEKLCQVDALSKDKQQCQSVLQLLQQLARAGLLSGKQEHRWQKVMQASYNAQVSITNGGQPKLALTTLMLSL